MSRRGDRDRWDRLQAKSLDQQFISEMREGLKLASRLGRLQRKSMRFMAPYSRPAPTPNRARFNSWSSTLL